MTKFKVQILPSDTIVPVNKLCLHTCVEGENNNLMIVLMYEINAYTTKEISLSFNNKYYKVIL